MDHQVAVVGGSGFLGANLVAELIQAGFTPVVIARRPEKIAEVLPGLKVETRPADWADLDRLRSALRGCAVVHCVAGAVREVYGSSSSDRFRATVQENVQGLLNVLRAAREVGARRVVVASTCVIRYRPGSVLINEESPLPDPSVLDDTYVRTKAAQDAAIKAFVQETAFQVISIMPGGVVGPRDAGPSPLGQSLLDFLNGRLPVGIQGSFPIVDVRDVARAHIVAMDRGVPGRSYLMVARTVTLCEWFAVLSRITGLPTPRVFVPASIALPAARLAEILAQVTHSVPVFTCNQIQQLVLPRHYDSSRAQRELGIVFTPLETTARDAIQWYVEKGRVSQTRELVPLAANMHNAGSSPGADK